MARRTLTFKADYGRDAGREFLITEKSATDAEMWAMRCFLAMGSSGIDIPENVAQLGLVGLVQYAAKLLLQIPFEKAKPLLDEMMECVECIPSPGIKRPVVDGDIEEVVTRFNLRKAIMELHVGFFENGERQTSDPGRPTNENTNSSNTRTRRVSVPQRSQQK